jgi:hypothetical protein
MGTWVCFNTLLMLLHGFSGHTANGLTLVVSISMAACRMKARAVLLVLVVTLCISMAAGGPAAGMTTYGACQTGCNIAAAACYTSAGVIFGTITFGLGVPSAVAACAAQQGACMAACAAMAGLAAITPTP